MHRPTVRSAALAPLLLVLTAAADHAARAQGPQPARARADFNGDGFADLAIGAFAEGIRAGAVYVLYGSSAGLATGTGQLWTQNTAGVRDFSEFEDNFGYALGAGDFDGDGFGDLAIGARGENEGEGAVTVLYGSAGGLTSTGTQRWSQRSTGIRGIAQSGDFFGSSLASADFDDDGFFDLAVGVFGETVNGAAGAGAVTVLYGSILGLRIARTQFWTQDSPLGVHDEAEENDNFGFSLTAADFDADGFADLAVGVPGETVDGAPFAGAVSVLFGGAAGLAGGDDQLWTLNSPGLRDSSETEDLFGESLTAGDFDGDGFADLAIGALFEAVGSGPPAGAVNVLYGSAAGLASKRNQLWTQDSPQGLHGMAATFDQFGNSLAAADLNGDSFTDLAIGVPNDHDPDGTQPLPGGTVQVLYGAPGGLSASNDQLWSQDTPGIAEKGETNDAFGTALAAGDFDADGFADLAVGSLEQFGGSPQAGAVHVIYGTAEGLQAPGSQLLFEGSAPGLPGVAQHDDFFGFSLVAQ
jgi:hypothetical protein